ncbi:MAG: response regulator [Candidatus Omnitrophica bacterium]|nr:response regulator [Candidatus Omnitrophota bacterium]
MAKRKILVVDDEPDFVKLLAFDLKKQGYEVVTAGDGEEGLEKIGSENPDLVIFDIKMPKMEGYTFVRNLRKNAERSSIPLIALTGYDSMRDMFEIEGVKEYFIKSTQTDSLLQAIKRYLPPDTNPAG